MIYYDKHFEKRVKDEIPDKSRQDIVRLILDRNWNA